MIEEWREYKNEEFPNYEVSNLGRVRNKITKHIMSGFKTHYGYIAVRLHNNKIQKDKLVHRLVTETFLSNPLNLTDINHIDGDKTNNKLTNLEWCNRSYNIQHAYNNGLRDRRKVRCIETNTIMTMDEILSFLNKKNVISNISACCRGKSKSAYGYHWEYV